MPNQNIVDLAHRVLGADKVGRDLNNAGAWDAVDLVLENAPILAHAVLRVAELADDLENQGHRGLDSKAPANITAGMAEVAAADRIRAALNAETNG